MTLEMQIFYLPIKTLQCEFLYSVKTDQFQSTWEFGKISHQLTLVQHNLDDVKKRIGKSKYAECIGVPVDDLTNVDVKLVDMKMVPA